MAGISRLRNGFSQWRMTAVNLGSFRNLNGGKIGLDDALVTGGLLSRGPTPEFLDDLSFADVLRSNDRTIVICAGKDEFVAQIEHEHVGVASIEGTENGRVRLGRQQW